MIPRFLWVMLAIPVLISAQTGPGPCHPYPGAVAGDVLELISKHLNDDTETPVDKSGRAVLNLRNAVIVTAVTKNATSVVNDLMVRRALTALGACALSDFGSVSGYYIGEDGGKTCYLYPGSEGNCSL
ncbi:hypothetical protein F5H01DRAFT_358881 [Linnemannia elongata]|nr:hypothetical protein F5H01DRAFT_358881 [Linnemannia elongata]